MKIKRDYIKIKRCIHSCNTLDQINSCTMMLITFINKYINSHFYTSSIMVSELNTLLKLKQQSITS